MATSSTSVARGAVPFKSHGGRIPFLIFCLFTSAAHGSRSSPSGAPHKFPHDNDRDGPHINRILLSATEHILEHANAAIKIIPDAPGTNNVVATEHTRSGINITDAAIVRAAVPGVCTRQMTGLVTWTLATAGGRDCQAACQGSGGAKDSGLTAINANTDASPAYVCRVEGATSMRAGFSQQIGVLATPCYGYSMPSTNVAKGGMVILSANSLECACVATPNNSEFSGCPQPVWKTAATSADCSITCKGGNSAAVNEGGSSSLNICRPEKSARAGWVAAQEGKNACHFATTTPSNSAKGSPQAVSAFAFKYDCLCI